MPDAPTLANWELAVRLVLTFLLCGLIGLERESRGEAAGLRTHILVGLGACLFTIISAYGFGDFSEAAPNRDPARISAQIVTGIGFLGAGAIMREGWGVRGLTTAAALWIAAAIGMAAGAGYYEAAIITTVIVMGALIVLLRLRPLIRSHTRSETLEMQADLRQGTDAEQLCRLMERRGVEVDAMDVSAQAKGEKLHLVLRVPPGTNFAPLLREMSELSGVKKVSVAGMHWHGDSADTS
ncbi:MAG: MgtC/SapB family protein [Acidimicrobiales bacterium]